MMIMIMILYFLMFNFTLLISNLIYQAIFYSDASLRSQDDDPAICLVCGRLLNAGDLLIMIMSSIYYTVDDVLIMMMSHDDESWWL